MLKAITSKGSIALRAGRVNARRCFGRYKGSGVGVSKLGLSSKFNVVSFRWVSKKTGYAILQCVPLSQLRFWQFL